MHLKEKNILHYIMYPVRSKNRSIHSNELGYIKYPSEYDNAIYYKEELEKSGLNIDEFLKNT